MERAGAPSPWAPNAVEQAAELLVSTTAFSTALDRIFNEQGIGTDELTPVELMATLKEATKEAEQVYALLGRL